MHTLHAFRSEPSFPPSRARRAGLVDSEWDLQIQRTMMVSSGSTNVGALVGSADTMPSNLKALIDTRKMRGRRAPLAIFEGGADNKRMRSLIQHVHDSP